MAKAERFSVQPSHPLTRKVLHDVPKRMGSGVSRPTVCITYANRRGPSFKMFFVAITSRSWTAPHTGQIDNRYKFLCPKPLSAAGRTTELVGWKKTINFDRLFLMPRHLVLQLPPELIPGSVRDRPGQLVILHHAGLCEILHRNQVIIPYKVGGQLMQDVSPLVCNMLLQSGNLDSRLLPTLTAF